MTSFGSLFSGVGGGDLGLEQAGMTVRWQCEIEPFPRRVLGAHWLDVPCHEDATKLDGRELEPVDCIIFGSPCQDLSVAGKRAGLGGERSSLFFEAVRIIREVRPAFVVWENVPGAFSSNGGADFGAVLDALADIGALDIAWRVVDSQFFGVPQRRRRIYLVADFRGERAGQILFEREGGAGRLASGGTPGEDIARALTSSAGGSSGKEQQHAFVVARALTSPDSPRYDGDTENFLVSALTTRAYADNEAQEDRLVVAHAVPFVKTARAHFAGDAETYAAGAVSPTLNGFDAGESRASTLVAATLTASNGARSNTGGRRREDDRNLVAYALRSDPGGTGQGHNTNYVTHALTCEGHDASEDGTGRGTPIVAATLKQRMRGATDEVMDNIQVRVGGVRRLTPVECERLQGFPDGWTAIDGDATPDSPRYRALGNAMTVNVTRWIGQRILAAAGGAQ